MSTQKILHRKKKRIKCTGLGTHVLPELIPSKLEAAARKSDEVETPAPLSDSEIAALVEKQSQSCRKKFCKSFKEQGCFMDIFRRVS